MVEKLLPSADDFIVLKSKHSGFFATPLDQVVRYIGARTLVICGLTTDVCVQFTACGAYLRDYHLVVPSDCVASPSSLHQKSSLNYMRRVLAADTSRSELLSLKALKRNPG